MMQEENLSKDIQLMLKFQAGDEACFEELVEHYKNHVFRMAMYFLKDRHEAEDAAQEVFIKIYNNKSQYKVTAKFSTWVFTICKNVCLNKLRVKKPFFVSLHHTPNDNERAPISDTIADENSKTPLQVMVSNETAQAVKEAIYKLPEQQKMAVILRRYEGLSYEEIAKVMDTTVKAVKGLLHRAKLTLKDSLISYVS